MPKSATEVRQPKKTLKHLRVTRLNMKAVDVAKRLGISSVFYYKIERRVSRPAVDHVPRFAEVFGESQESIRDILGIKCW